MIAPMRRARKRARGVRNDALMTRCPETMLGREIFPDNGRQAHVFVKEFTMKPYFVKRAPL